MQKTRLAPSLLCATALPGIIDGLRSRGYCLGKIQKADTYDQRNLSSVKVVAW